MLSSRFLNNNKCLSKVFSSFLLSALDTCSKVAHIAKCDDDDDEQRNSMEEKKCIKTVECEIKMK